MLSTENMGGVVVTPNQLSDMQASDYILHARGGVLNKVEVEKTRMPLDPKAHYQALNLVLTPDGIIYAVQQTIFSKSTDGGKTWEHLNRDPSAFGFSGWLLQANRHGQLINVSQQGEEQPTPVWRSDDEGETWEQTSEIDVAPFQKTVAGSSLTRLSDGTLLLPIKRRDDPFDEGTNPTYVFVSEDDGHTFPNRFFLSDYGNEVNIAELFPGQLLMIMTYYLDQWDVWIGSFSAEYPRRCIRNAGSASQVQRGF
ncbi:MAG: sialidase family protein [Candidatus Poribacteria bacterium]|nr:sialidase family protein [Candidatus Poribacteria bacterium]